MQIQKNLLWIDVLVLLALPIASAFISILFRMPYLVSTVLFYGTPGIYLSLRFGRAWQVAKGFFFAFIASVPFVIVVDYIGTTSGLWHVPTTVFSGRFLSVIPLEDFIWMLAATYTIVVTYELLFNEGKQELVDRRMWHFGLSGLLGLGIFFVLLGSQQQTIFAWHSQFAYLYLGTIFFLIPAMLFLVRFPEFLRHSLPIVGYFLYMTFLFETTATFLQQWVFAGSYLFPALNLFGNNPIPYEELFFVGVVGPLAAIAFFEFFDDDPI